MAHGLASTRIPTGCVPVYFLILEMFLWTRQLGLKTFHNSIAGAESDGWILFVQPPMLPSL